MSDIFAKKRRVVSVRVITTGFGAKIKEARTRADMTQAELAKKMGYSRTQLVNIEAGRSLMALPVFVKLCRLLRTTPNEMLEFK